MYWQPINKRSGGFGSIRGSSTIFWGLWRHLRCWHHAILRAMTSCAPMLPTWQSEVFWLNRNPGDQRASCWNVRRESSLKNYMTSKRVMQRTPTSCWLSTSIWCPGSLTSLINVRQCIRTTRRCSISWARRSSLAAHGDTWINCSRSTVQSCTSQGWPIW